MSQLYRVPPSPEVMSLLYADYLKYGKPLGISFKKYLEAIGFTDPAADQPVMDSGVGVDSDGIQQIGVPSKPVNGQVHIKVLLVDFPDREGVLSLDHYETLLFSKGRYPTGSLAEYYHEVSLGNVEVTGSIHGWLRMPEPYSFYTNNESGTKWNSYPRNAPRLAEDAVNIAKGYGITFEPELDKFKQGIVTALFLIHAGRGAETTHPTIRGREIWSHKWQLRNPVEVSPGLFATIYLTVPYDCKIGVCAHELGHLVFQWQDFYDPNYDEDGNEWAGSGQWDLMAGGSYNGNGGTRPAHPAALHKLQHNWLKAKPITASTPGVEIPPYSATSGKVIRLKSKAYKSKQYLLLENRSRRGFDSDLPGEGLLVWAVDESREMVSSENPGLLLIQADGRHDLESVTDWNQGDEDDPFPGATGRTELPDTGDTSTSFDGKRSGITLKNISRNPITKDISLDIEFSK
jgi:immune inhibitor A